MPVCTGSPNEAPSKITWSSSAVADSASNDWVSSSLACSLRWAAARSSSSVRDLHARARGRAAAPSRWPARAGARRWAGRCSPSHPCAGPARSGPTAWAKNSGVEALVAYTPTDSRGMSTPSETIRTATSQRCWPIGEVGDPLRGAGVVGEHHDRLLAGDGLQQLGVRPGGRPVGRDDQPGRVRNATGPLDLQPRVRRPQHLRHPVAGRVQRGPPGVGHHVAGHRLARGARPARRRPRCASASPPSRPGRSPDGPRRRAGRRSTRTRCRTGTGAGRRRRARR